METNGVYNVDENSTSVNDSENTPSDLGDNGVKTLQKLRQEIKRLETKNKEYETRYLGINLDEIKSQEKTLTEQIADLKSQLLEAKSKVKEVETDYKSLLKQKDNEIKQRESKISELDSWITGAKIKAEFDRVVNQKLDSRYNNLAWATVKDQVQLTDGAIKVGDRDLEQYLDEFLTQYPESGKLSLGSNLTGSNSIAIKSESIKVLPRSNDAFLANLDAIISGDAVLE